MLKGTTKLVRDTAADFVTGLLIFFAVYAVALVDSNSAWPATPADPVWQVHHQSEAAGNSQSMTRGLPLSQPAARVSSEKRLGGQSATAPDKQRPSISSNSTSVRIAELSKARRNYTLRGAAAGERVGTLAAMALFFSAMCAVTLGFWRHIRRSYASPRRN